MSITFEVEGTPYEDYIPFPDTEPKFVGKRPVAPYTALNLANGNAADFIRTLESGLCTRNEPWYGEWSGENLNTIYERLMFLLNTNAGKALESEVVTQIHGGAITIHVGRDAAYVIDRLTRLLEIVKHARQLGRKVIYA